VHYSKKIHGKAAFFLLENFSLKLEKGKRDKVQTKKSKLVYDLSLLRTNFALPVVYV